MSEDPRLAAARYRVDKLAQDESVETRPEAVRAEAPGSDGSNPAPPDAEASASRTRAANAVDRAAYVETSIQQAIRRGDFDDLPGAGKPIPGLGQGHDPDWWIRRKIETERLTGLGPPALMLRVEDRELADRLDALSREQDVHEAVEDFNRRVIEARRQLLGGPPVVTPLRDVDDEVTAWRERRDARFAQADATAAAEAEARAERRARGIPSLFLGVFRRSGRD
jgi:hypothetical protein